MNKHALTGSAGWLGSYLSEPLSNMADTPVSTDLADDIGTLYSGEAYRGADLGDLSAMTALMDGAHMVVHFGAIGDEAPWGAILHSNIIGAYNVWEAAHQCGVQRVTNASSIHVVGLHEKTDFTGTDAHHRPDTHYGLAKCFAGDRGSLYRDNRQLGSVCLRILSCAQVSNARALGSWLSYDDLIQLVECSITTPVTGFTIAYGVSNNDRAPANNAKASFLGYRPKDNAEQFAATILREEPPLAPNNPGAMCQGGPFASVPLGESGTATMKIVNDKKEA